MMTWKPLAGVTAVHLVRLNMQPIAIRQKTGNHCFVACVASALLDEGYDKLQDLIVDRFPSELGKDSADKPSVPQKWADLEAVIKGLQLATSVARYQMPAQDAKSFLILNKHKPRWIFIETTRQGTHCVRLCEIRDDAVTVMDPTDGKFHEWTWQQFDNSYRALVLLDFG